MLPKHKLGAMVRVMTIALGTLTLAACASGPTSSYPATGKQSMPDMKACPCCAKMGQDGKGCCSGMGGCPCCDGGKDMVMKPGMTCNPLAK